MSDETSATTGERTVSALFDNAATAHAAVEALLAAGVRRDRIAQTGGQGAEEIARPAKGFWETLVDFFGPEQDGERHLFEEGLRRGGYLITVSTTAEGEGAVRDLLARTGAVDMARRSEEWRAAGWAPMIPPEAAEVSLMTGMIGWPGDSAFVADEGIDRTPARGDMPDPETVARIRPGMAVLASDGTPLGTAGRVDAERLVLQQTPQTGAELAVPLGWVARVDDEIHLDRSAAEIPSENPLPPAL